PSENSQTKCLDSAAYFAERFQLACVSAASSTKLSASALIQPARRASGVRALAPRAHRVVRDRSVAAGQGWRTVRRGGGRWALRQMVNPRKSRTSTHSICFMPKAVFPADRFAIDTGRTTSQHQKQSNTINIGRQRGIQDCRRAGTRRLFDAKKLAATAV